jgi:hypothetical protein
MASNNLPVWASWVQVLGVPVTGVILTLVIACVQQRLQNIRLRHDLYDRRYRVYGAAKELLASVQVDGSVKRPAFQAFVERTSDAEFLFKNQDIFEYLTKLREKAIRSIHVSTKLSDANLKTKDSDKFADEEGEIAKWFIAQFGTLRDKFKPFMRLY